MIRRKNMWRIIHSGIAVVWIINGLFCKAFNLVPRHQEIVGQILGHEYAATLTIIIGVLETLLGVWILTKRWHQYTAIFQIILVMSMNLIEFTLVPEMLLWGKFNLIFAALFSLIIFLDAFHQHPFSIEAYFERTTVLTFAFPKEQLAHLIPKPLLLDTFQDTYAFVAIAMVQTKDMRIKGFPKLFGRDFFLIGYRVFTQYHNQAGKRLRGLYILKSETDSKAMKIMGNLMTNYAYDYQHIHQMHESERYQIQVAQTGFDVQISKKNENISLPAGSPFSDWKEARRYAGPLPFTFYVDSDQQQINIIEGQRQNWTPQPVEVIKYQIPFLKHFSQEDIQLASAFQIQHIPYTWKKGWVEKC